MKKLISFVLVLTLVISLGVTASASSVITTHFMRDAQGPWWTLTVFENGEELGSTRVHNRNLNTGGILNVTLEGRTFRFIVGAGSGGSIIPIISEERPGGSGNLPELITFFIGNTLWIGAESRFFAYDDVYPAPVRNRNVTWSSSDEDIATVTEDGWVTAIAVGEAALTATAPDGRTATADVFVERPPIFGLSTEARNINPGDYFTINAAFTEETETNAIVLGFFFDGDKFEYADFIPAAGVGVVVASHGDGFARITLMVRGYDAQNLGDLMLRAREDSELVRGWQHVEVDVDFVLRDEYGEKTIEETWAWVGFTTGFLRGDTNDDGVVDLIDLSNMIDWFGIDYTHENWDDWYSFFDFNNSGMIDIYDIVFVARLIHIEPLYEEIEDEDVPRGAFPRRTPRAPLEDEEEDEDPEEPENRENPAGDPESTDGQDGEPEQDENTTEESEQEEYTTEEPEEDEATAEESEATTGEAAPPDEEI